MRKAKPKKRLILPDPVFNDQKVSKFVNHLMYDGKKNTSYEIFYAALETVKNKMQNEEKSEMCIRDRSQPGGKNRQSRLLSVNPTDNLPTHHSSWQ